MDLGKLAAEMSLLADDIDKGTSGPWTAAKLGNTLVAGKVYEDTETALSADRTVLEADTFDLSDYAKRKLRRDLKAVARARNDAPRLLRQAATALIAAHESNLLGGGE